MNNSTVDIFNYLNNKAVTRNQDNISKIIEKSNDRFTNRFIKLNPTHKIVDAKGCITSYTSTSKK